MKTKNLFPRAYGQELLKIINGDESKETLEKIAKKTRKTSKQVTADVDRLDAWLCEKNEI